MNFEDSNSGDENDNEELTTPEQVVLKLEEVWVNEKLAPELLNYKGDLVDCLLDQIQHMESSLLRIEKDDFRIVFHKMELDRIKFVLSSYLRIRLEKIEKFGSYLLHQEQQEPEYLSNMSDEERNFAHRYVSSVKNYLQDTALKNMPVNMQTLKLEEVSSKPHLDSSVFIKVKKESRGILIEESADYGDEEVIDLAQGSQYILRYKPIASLLKNESVQLI